MINVTILLLWILPLFTNLNLIPQVNATPNHCQELAAELTLVQEEFDFTDQEIRDFYQRCVTAEAWGTDKT